MSEQTPRLKMPFIMPGQAQKHVTHNEALQKLDCLVQCVLLGTRAEPPSTATEGDGYLVAPSPSGAWQGKGGTLAFHQDGAWQFATPLAGWRAWFADHNRQLVFTGSGWEELPLPQNGRLEKLGIGTDADSTNRLAIASTASLFSHDGAGHQIKVNKATATDTASLLFQSGWTGHAEMGLAGSNAFSVKVSPDGQNWHTALTISGTGKVEMPRRPLATAGRETATVTINSAGVSGFTILEQQGGFLQGANVAGGTGKELIVPASGLYLVMLTLATAGSSAHGLTLMANGAATSLKISGREATSPVCHGVSAVLTLTAGDRLSLAFNGTANIEFGPGKTGLTLMAV